MTALDPITAASPTFLNAKRHGYREGSALQIMRPNTPRLLTAWAWAVLPHLAGVALFLLVVGLVFGGVPS